MKTLTQRMKTRSASELATKQRECSHNYVEYSRSRKHCTKCGDNQPIKAKKIVEKVLGA